MKSYWKKISENYPFLFWQLITDAETIKAWSVYRDATTDEKTIWKDFSSVPKHALRYLFDFFDSRKIHAYCYTGNGKEWHYAILTKKRLLTASSEKYKNRHLAELAAFEKCFELLARMHNKKTKL